MKLGIDVSTYLEESEHGARYFDGNTEVDPLDLFRANGVEGMRIRLWVDPESEDGKPYLAGNCDLENFIRLAKLAGSKGYKIMLDFHYSDFWADPGKQTLPKAWQGLDLNGLADEVYVYTAKTLKRIAEEGIELSYIQVGNEITNGMLWPVGKLIEQPDGSRTNFESLIELFRAGARACREYAPKAAIVLHLEKSHDQTIYNEYLTHFQEAGVDYDIIGYSYYPYWHGTFDMFFANVDMCKKFGKRQMVVELGYGFTTEDYVKNEHGGAQLVVSEDNLATLDFTKKYPLTRDGQARFVGDFLRLAKQHGIEEVYYWEPLWIPGEGICWASEEAMEYTGDAKRYADAGKKKSTRNEWANQCLFDYEGRKLPAFDAYKIK